MVNEFMRTICKIICHNSQKDVNCLDNIGSASLKPGPINDDYLVFLAFEIPVQIS